MKADIIVGLVAGDESKSKVAYSCLKRSQYSYSFRANGSNNAGRAIMFNGKRIVMHSVPAGVLVGIPSIIGCGCVVHPATLMKEIEDLEKEGIEASKLVKVAYNTHIITDEHIEEDKKDVIIGTTNKGTGGAYRDKYARVGKRAENVPELKPFLIDIYEEFYIKNPDAVILGEVVQGFAIEIDYCWTFPFCTSSKCTASAFLDNGFPHQCIRDVIGCFKIYDTFVSKNKFQPDGEIFNLIAEKGSEIGNSTGRRRQVNYLNLNQLLKAIRINGCTKVVCSKMDILRDLNHWRLIADGKIEEHTEESIKARLEEAIKLPIEYSYSPESL